MKTRPKLFIFTGATEVTGALIAACREAHLLKPIVDVTIVLSSRSQLTAAMLPGEPALLKLPLAQPRKDLRMMLAYPFALIRSGWHLNRALARAGCQRLQMNDYYFLEGVVARSLGYRGRIITWVRIEPKAYGGAISRLWLTFARRTSDRMVAVSRFIQSALPPKTKTALVYDPAPEVLEPTPRPASQCFIFIGNYIKGKGQNLAIQAFHRIADEFPNAELVFHGSDMGLAENRRYRARLERMVRSGSGHSRIHLRSYESALAPVYARALAALNCSYSESFSLTCQEASSNGLPVIATRSGGPQEIIEDGSTGFLVPVGDVEALADRMRTLLDDPGKAAAMGRAGAELVRDRFSADRFCEQLTDLFGLGHQE